MFPIDIEIMLKTSRHWVLPMANLPMAYVDIENARPASLDKDGWGSNEMGRAWGLDSASRFRCCTEHSQARVKWLRLLTVSGRELPSALPVGL